MSKRVLFLFVAISIHAYWASARSTEEDIYYTEFDGYDSKDNYYQNDEIEDSSPPESNGEADKGDLLEINSEDSDNDEYTSSQSSAEEYQDEKDDKITDMVLRKMDRKFDTLRRQQNMAINRQFAKARQHQNEENSSLKKKINMIENRVDKLLCMRKTPMSKEKVTCSIVVDDFLRSVHYDNRYLEVKVDKIGAISWRNLKTVAFTPTNSNCDSGELKIVAEDDSAGAGDHCRSAGLLLHCTSSDPHSPWHNFKSNAMDWRNADGTPVCANDAGFVKNFQTTKDPWFKKNLPWMTKLLHAGAKKIWGGSKRKMVTLIGKPI